MTALRTGLLHVATGCALAALAIGCGGTSSTAGSGETTTPSASDTSTATTRNGHTDPELASLRPAGSEDVLTYLERDAQNPDAYARATLLYAGTDVPGMAIVWGQIYRILDPQGRKTVEITGAMKQVLVQQIVPAANGTDLEMRFAPGAMPMLADTGGRYLAPFAHLYEHSMNLATGLTTPRDQFEGASAVFAAELRVVCRAGEPVLDDTFYRWLCELASAGHSDVYAHWVIGPAFGPDYERFEQSHATAVDAFRTWLAAHAYRPIRPTRPDDVYPVRPRS